MVSRHRMHCEETFAIHFLIFIYLLLNILIACLHLAGAFIQVRDESEQISPIRLAMDLLYGAYFWQWSSILFHHRLIRLTFISEFDLWKVLKQQYLFQALPEDLLFYWSTTVTSQGRRSIPLMLPNEDSGASPLFFLLSSVVFVGLYSAMIKPFVL